MFSVCYSSPGCPTLVGLSKTFTPKILHVHSLALHCEGRELPPPRSTHGLLMASSISAVFHYYSFPYIGPIFPPISIIRRPCAHDAWTRVRDPQAHAVGPPFPAGCSQLSPTGLLRGDSKRQSKLQTEAQGSKVTTNECCSGWNPPT